MKIFCTVSEFAKMVRKCRDGPCYSCALSDICDETKGVEQFVSSDGIISDEEELNREPA